MAYDEDLADRIRVCLSGTDGVREKRMFGGLAFLLGGHMAVAASGHGGLMLRVDPARTDEHLAEAGVEPMEMKGRPVDGWVRVQAAALADDAALRRWIEVGVAYASSLPPK